MSVSNEEANNCDKNGEKPARGVVYYLVWFVVLSAVVCLGYRAKQILTAPLPPKALSFYVATDKFVSKYGLTELSKETIGDDTHHTFSFASVRNATFVIIFKGSRWDSYQLTFHDGSPLDAEKWKVITDLLKRFYSSESKIRTASSYIRKRMGVLAANSEKGMSEADPLYLDGFIIRAGVFNNKPMVSIAYRWF